MRVVCDTNILISAAVFPGGPPEKVLDLGRLKEIELFLSPDILTEFKTVLIRKFRYTEKEAAEFLARSLSCATLVYPRERLQLISRCDADNRILECVAEAKANFLVTGDKRDLLPLKHHGACRIVTAAQFLALES